MREKLTLTAVLITAILVTMAWPIGTAKCDMVTDGLISYWDFDGSDGDTVEDTWGDNDGTIMGGAEIVDEGRSGDALDPAPGNVEYDDSQMPAGNDPRTVSAWVNFEAIPPSYSAVVEWGSMPEAQRFGLMLTDFGGVLSVGEMADMQSDGAMEAGEWNHVTITYDSDLLRIYINGELDKEGRPGLQWGNAARDLETLLSKGTIGSNLDGGEPFTAGIIDEVSIYDRALSADEVEQNFNAEGIAVNSAGKAALTWGAIKSSN